VPGFPIVMEGCRRDPSSSGAGPSVAFTATNARRYVAFDSSSAEYLISYSRPLPADYASGGALNFLWSASGASAPGASVDTVQWSGQVMAVTPNNDTASMLTESFSTAATVSDEADNSNARALMLATVTLNMDSAAAGDYIVFRFGRTAAASTKLAEDAWLWALEFTYTAA